MAKVNADLIWYNGKLMPWKDATVHVMSHALHTKRIKALVFFV